MFIESNSYFLWNSHLVVLRTHKMYCVMLLAYILKSIHFLHSRRIKWTSTKICYFLFNMVLFIARCSYPTPNRTCSKQMLYCPTDLLYILITTAFNIHVDAIGWIVLRFYTSNPVCSSIHDLKTSYPAINTVIHFAIILKDFNWIKHLIFHTFA